MRTFGFWSNRKPVFQTEKKTSQSNDLADALFKKIHVKNCQKPQDTSQDCVEEKKVSGQSLGKKEAGGISPGM